MSETVRADKHLHPATPVIGLLRTLPQFALVPPMVALYAADVDTRLAILIGFAGVAVAIGYAWLAWSRFGYSFADGQLVIERGILSRNRRTIPFDRIQDVSLEQKLLGRIFGIATVRIETGSGDSDEGLLDAVSMTEAAALRDAIRRHRAVEPEASAAPAAGASVPKAAPVRLLFRMSVSRLLILGVFSFSFVFLALIGAIGQYAFSWMPFSYADPARYIEMGDLPIGQRNEIMALWNWGNSLAIALFVVAAGMVSGLAKVVTRDFGFRLTRTETGLRRQRGLFTRTDVVMPLKRVQAAIVSTGILRKLFGWRGLSLQSLGTDTDKETHHVVAPLARPRELIPILAELGLDPPPERAAFTAISPRTVTIGLIGTLIAIPFALAGAAAIGVFAGNGAGLLLLVPALLPLAAALVRRYSHRWHRARGLLFVRKGVASQGVTILDRVKIQSVSLRRGPLQRPFGLATLVIGTAGASRKSPLRIVDLAEAEARQLMDGWLLDEASVPLDIANRPASA